MKYQALRKLIAPIAVLLLLGVGVKACATNSTSWREQVALHDGTSLIVQRTQTVDPHGFREIGQGPPLSEETLAFTMPGGNKVRWRSDFGGSYQDNLRPLALDIVDGSPYLVTNPTGCGAYNKWGRPNPPYVYFRYGGARWQRIVLQELPSVIDHANLMIGGFFSRGRQLSDADRRAEYVPAKSIRKVNREMTSEGRYLRQFTRQPMKGGETGCEKLVQDGNGGWLSSDWFWRQPNLRACLECVRAIRFLAGIACAISISMEMTVMTTDPEFALMAGAAYQSPQGAGCDKPATWPRWLGQLYI